MTADAKGTGQMDTVPLDPELAAINAVLTALSSLRDESRERVIDYVLNRLGLEDRRQESPDNKAKADAQSRGEDSDITGKAPRDIRSLAETKKPRNVVERAVLVAYYLSELAPSDRRKAEIGTKDLNSYFKQAGFPIPSEPRRVLFHARTGGYLDAGSKRGTYKLNPVGHNLVVHTLPSDKPVRSSATRAKKARKSRSAAKRGKRK